MEGQGAECARAWLQDAAIGYLNERDTGGLASESLIKERTTRNYQRWRCRTRGIKPKPLLGLRPRRLVAKEFAANIAQALT
jgi:hypothetical protein